MAPSSSPLIVLEDDKESIVASNYEAQGSFIVQCQNSIIMCSGLGGTLRKINYLLQSIAARRCQQLSLLLMKDARHGANS